MLAAPFVVILYLNIETYAQSKGWDTLLKGAMEGQVPAIVDWALQPWVGLTSLALISFTLGLWFDAVLRRRERKSFVVGPQIIDPVGEAAQRTILKALDDLFAEGTKHMNRLIPPIPDYDDKAERSVLDEWQDRALKKMDEAGVSVPIMSRFKTFWKFNPTFHRITDKSAQQELLEGIWDEKLRQLRIIIDSFDNPRKS